MFPETHRSGQMRVNHGLWITGNGQTNNDWWLKTNNSWVGQYTLFAIIQGFFVWSFYPIPVTVPTVANNPGPNDLLSDFIMASQLLEGTCQSQTAWFHHGVTAAWGNMPISNSLVFRKVTFIDPPTMILCVKSIGLTAMRHFLFNVAVRVQVVKIFAVKTNNFIVLWTFLLFLELRNI